MLVPLLLLGIYFLNQNQIPFYLCMIHIYDFLFNLRNIFLSLFHYFRFKSRISILRNFNLELTKSRTYTIAIIRSIRMLIFFISNMFIHFSFQHRFNCFSNKIFKSFLNIFSSFNIILFN